MPIADEVLNSIFDQALTKFLCIEEQAILESVSERNNCGRFAIYLDEFANANGLTGYFADIEYNRKQNGEIKTILGPRLRIIRINCDLILHSRGNLVGEDNLIAIEMKKFERPSSEKSNDRARLRAMTKESFDDIWSADGFTHPEHVCGYRLGAFIELNKDQRSCNIEFFKKGRCVSRQLKTF